MNNRQQGYILVVVLCTLLVVAGMAVMTVSMTGTEIRQSGGNQMVARVRAAAEAGQADALFYMSNDGLQDVNTTLMPYADTFAGTTADASTQPIIPKTAFSSIISTLNHAAGMLIAGTSNSAAYTVSIVYNSMDVDESTFSAQGQTYVLNYTAKSIGNFSGNLRTVTTNGQMQVRMGRNFLNQFILLANDGGSQQGNFFASGMNYDGPVQVNQNWEFAGKPKFKYGATTASSTVQMSSDCNPSNQSTVSTQANGCTVPDWGGYGLRYSSPRIDLPVNAKSQQKAALGLNASNTTALSNYDECVALGKNMPACTATSVAPNGVYVPYNASNTVTGGIYIKGDARSITLSVSGNKQTYTIIDANNVTTTITVDYTAGTTTLVKGSVTTVLTGVLSGEAKTPGQPNGMIYSTGNVVSLNGPARLSGALGTPIPAVPDPTKIPPAVAANSVINIASAGSITVNSDVTYQQDPRTTPGAKNVLGLMAGTGSVRIGASAPDDVYVQAALLAGAANQGFAVDDYGSRVRGSIHLLGSLAEDKEPARGIGAQTASKDDIYMVAGYGDAFNFDPRFLNGGAVPPFFPATSKFSAQSVWPSQQGWKEQ